MFVVWLDLSVHECSQNPVFSVWQIFTVLSLFTYCLIFCKHTAKVLIFTWKCCLVNSTLVALHRLKLKDKFLVFTYFLKNVLFSNICKWNVSYQSLQDNLQSVYTQSYVFVLDRCMEVSQKAKLQKSADSAKKVRRSIMTLHTVRVPVILIFEECKQRKTVKPSPLVMLRSRRLQMNATCWEISWPDFLDAESQHSHVRRRH